MCFWVFLYIWIIHKKLSSWVGAPSYGWVKHKRRNTRPYLFISNNLYSFHGNFTFKQFSQGCKVQINRIEPVRCGCELFGGQLNKQMARSKCQQFCSKTQSLLLLDLNGQHTCYWSSRALTFRMQDAGVCRRRIEFNLHFYLFISSLPTLFYDPERKYAGQK